MDEISKAIHSAQAERRSHLVNSFSNLSEIISDEEMIRKADDEEMEEREEKNSEEENEEMNEEEAEKEEDDEETEKEEDEADGGESTTEKADIMYAISNGNVEVTKSGKEIKDQVDSVLLPELNSALLIKQKEASDKLSECGSAPTKCPEPWWTGDVKMDVGYKVYDWCETEYSNPNERMYDSLSALDEKEKKGNVPTSQAEAKARREYNDIVRAICNIKVDIKACEILKELKDETQYKLTPRQILTLKF